MTLGNLGTAVALVALLVPGMAEAKTTPDGTMPEASEEFVETGRQTYIKRCSFCHGLLGDGNGPAADYLDPRPRDFTLGTYKFRTTNSGELPTDNDMFRTVSRGLPGTAMQAFDNDTIKNGLSEEERWQVISYIKTFAIEFDDPELDPVKTGKTLSLPANRAPYSPELVAKGKEVFEKAKCWSCHGKTGRGDGNKEFRKDDWGFPIRIRNVTHPWKIKGGGEAEEIFMRFTSGINGTPMPSFVKTLSEDDRWALANFIKSLQHDLTKHQVLAALTVEGAVPDDPADEAWKNAAPMDVRLTGQVIAPPRWQNPSIEMATVQAIVNDKEIAFKMTWDDPFKDIKHDPAKEMNATEIQKVGLYSSYVAANDMIARDLETFRDSIALQFPVKTPSGTKKPHFFRGESSSQVNLWIWNADLAEQGEEATVEANARGWRQAPKPQKDDQRQVISKAAWDQGQWTVIMKRPLVTDDKNDVQFEAGKFIPVAMNAWDGSNGEHGLVMSLSSWHYVFIDAGIPASVYIFTALGFILTGGLLVWFARKAESTPQTDASEQT
ncbi:MAG: c-type cytochrome [Rhodospirillaceae bacterium]|nr:c-type cytochrome [Rhodospirillaceae bacterium]